MQETEGHFRKTVRMLRITDLRLRYELTANLRLLDFIRDRNATRFNPEDIQAFMASIQTLPKEALTRPWRVAEEARKAEPTAADTTNIQEYCEQWIRITNHAAYDLRQRQAWAFSPLFDGWVTEQETREIFASMTKPLETRLKQQNFATLSLWSAFWDELWEPGDKNWQYLKAGVIGVIPSIGRHAVEAVQGVSHMVMHPILTMEGIVDLLKEFKNDPGNATLDMLLPSDIETAPGDAAASVVEQFLLVKWATLITKRGLNAVRRGALKQELLAKIEREIPNPSMKDDLLRKLDIEGPEATLEYLVKKASESILDPRFSGALNPRGLQFSFVHLARESARSANKVSVIFFDVKLFKVMNDVLGYDRSNDVLESLIERLNRESRGLDFVGRFGGDEIVVVINGSKESAQALAKRVREGHRKTLAENFTPDILAAAEKNPNYRYLLEQSISETPVDRDILARFEIQAGLNDEVLTEPLVMDWRKKLEARVVVPGDVNAGIHEFDLSPAAMASAETQEQVLAEIFDRGTKNAFMALEEFKAAEKKALGINSRPNNPQAATQPGK